MNMDLQVPGAGELHRRIGALTGVAPEEVAAVLSKHGMELTGPLPTKRELVVHRLYCDGVKSGTEGNDGPFTVDMRLGRGPWAIASTINSAGKSSLLWALSFALRGEGFDAFCRPETEGWFRYVRADIAVGGVNASVRLSFERSGRPSARLLTADSIEALLALNGREEEHAGVYLSATADPAGVKTLIGSFMMERLGLRPVSVWAAEKGAPKNPDGDRDSVEQIHGWSSFFYAIALNSASDTLLLGPTIVGQLPVKLMQLFLDVPYASELSRVSTMRRAETQETQRIARRSHEDAIARKNHVAPLRQALTAAQQQLRDIENDHPDVRSLTTDSGRAAKILAQCHDAYDEAVENHTAARKDRQADERAQRRAKQSEAARLLLGALEPDTCPRCDHEIDDERRAAEESWHVCSICANPLPTTESDPEAEAEALARIELRLAASVSAEKSCLTVKDAAADDLKAAHTAYEEARAQVSEVRSSDWYAHMEDAQRTVQQLQGALTIAAGEPNSTTPRALLAALDGAPPETKRVAPTKPDDQTVLTAAAEVLKDIVDRHSRALFTELNDEIVRIARELGVTNLTSVNLTLGGQLNAMKSGARHRFSAFSPVDRLRMRIAVVVGMIVVSRRRGIMSHPGLLLIDAPTADELTPQVRFQVLDTLYRTGNSVPGLQMVITSIEEVLWDIFPEDRIITGKAQREMF
ncbi:hypothetical protein AB0N05_13700 [Nocardia sp. NPDC051030]|uniref:hypothetical protein n=1 Tax=Nocardia sp. NPDC051030 TaxID=3155162 RepID=UPI00342CD08D